MKVEKNGIVREVTLGDAIAAYLESGWTKVEEKPLKKEEPKAETSKKASK